MNKDDILKAAQAAPSKANVEDYREIVVTLRDKGFTWRDIADFLKERGVEMDHTRLYRAFGQSQKNRRKETRDIDIASITYKGERKTKKNNTWNVMELVLPTKLGMPINVIGYAWATGPTKSIWTNGSIINFKNALLVVKSGEGIPAAQINLELSIENAEWIKQEIYIMPKWDSLL